MRETAICMAVLVILTHLCHRFYFAGSWCPSEARMDGKLVIITGANTGIGRTTALDLARRGARLVLACRSGQKTLPVIREILASNPAADVVFMPLDLSSFLSVKNFANAFLVRETKLDVLIANAGIVGSDDVTFNENGIETTIAVNHLGHFYLTGLLKGALISAGPGSRVVVVSSHLFMFANDRAFVDLDDLKATGGMTDFPVNLNVPESEIHPVFRWQLTMVRTPRVVRYANSKLANILFVKEFSRKFETKAYSLHPGIIRTDIGWARADIGSLYYVVVNILKIVFPFYKTGREGAQTQICLSVGEKYDSQSGGYFSDCELFRTRKPEVNDVQLARDLWRWSEGIIGNAVGEPDYQF